MKRRNLIRPSIHRLSPYVPGEQPKIKGLIKLNTNENPYPPSPRVIKAVKAATDARLRLYPNPTAHFLRIKLAKLHRCKPENILVGNGSDELLALAVRCFVQPSAPNVRRARALVQFFTPSYSLYPVLAKIHGALPNPIPLNPDFSLPILSQLRRGKGWNTDAALTFITTPNAPSGRGYSTAELREICRIQHGVVVLDEAYVDFARESGLALGFQHSNVLIARTFSKAYSLCFQRVGYFLGHPDLIAALHKIRDSYNVNGLGQVAAEATLDDLPYYRANFHRIIATREGLRRELTALGFTVLPSETNFLLAAPPGAAASVWLQKLRERKILVRWFDQAQIRNFLRITVGTPEEAGAFVKAVKAELKLVGTLAIPHDADPELLSGQFCIPF
jgi:histidinol-phosphate aminotransferase